MKTYDVEDENSVVAEKILKDKGFTDIVRMPRLCLYDYEAKRDEKSVYIEVRCRSRGMAPIFVFKTGKLERLRELKRKTGRGVYILLFQGDVYKLFKLDEFPSVLKPFTLHIAGKGVKSWRFPVRGELTEEEKAEAIKLRKQGYTESRIAEVLQRSETSIRKHLPSDLRNLSAIRTRMPIETRVTKKEAMIRIRCEGSTKYQFEKFKLEWLLKNEEEALLYLLRKTREFEPSPPHGKIL